MQQRQLGRNGPMISAIGIGAMSFSDFYGPVSEQESHDVLTAALDEGVTHIDTSNVYGMGTSEESIGSFLKKQGTVTITVLAPPSRAMAAPSAEQRGGGEHTATAVPAAQGLSRAGSHLRHWHHPARRQVAEFA